MEQPYLSPKKRQRREAKTEMENNIVRLIAKGYTYEQIGKELFRSQRTVEAHTKALFLTHGCCNKASLVYKFVTLGRLKIEGS